MNALAKPSSRSTFRAELVLISYRLSCVTKSAWMTNLRRRHRSARLKRRQHSCDGAVLTLKLIRRSGRKAKTSCSCQRLLVFV